MLRASRQPYYRAFRALRYRFPVEEHGIFVGVEVGSLFAFVAAVGEDLLAFVSRVVDVVAGEYVFVYETLVFTAVTLYLLGSVACAREYVVERYGLVGAGRRLYVESASVCAHQLRHVASRCPALGK